MTRSPCSSTRVQPTPNSVQGGLSLSFVCASWSVADRIQPKPDQSNSQLPVRLASPMKFYQEWIQQSKVPPDRIPSVPVNAQSNRPVRVELDDGEIKDRFPANAVGLQAESMPIDSTGSNPEDRSELPSVSPVIPVSDVQLMRPMADISVPISQAGEPVSRIVRADTEMSASNRERRPDDVNNEAIYDDVRVMQIYSDVPVSHNGVPVTSESHNDVRTSKAEVRVKGASPPVVQGVLRGRAKGRTSSTPSAKFVYSCIRRSDTASSRSAMPKPSMKSNSAMALGCNKVSVSNFDKFEKEDQSDRFLPATPEDFPSPSRQMPSQFDFLMSNAGCEFDKVEFSNNPTPVFEPPAIIAFDRPNCAKVPDSSIITGLTTHSARTKFASDRQRPIMSHEALIMSPNYASKFERNGNYVSRSTTSHKPSTDR